MGCKAGQCKTSTSQGIFMVTPSLEGWPTKAKEAPSPHEVRLAPLDNNPVFESLRDETNSVLNKVKSAIPPLFNGPEVLSSASDKAKLFAENFSKNSNLDDSCISLPVFPSGTNLKLYSISVSPKMIKKVIMNLDLSKASGPDCIPVVVLKNCELELSYIVAELFNKCLKESCFPDCWKIS